MVGDSYHGVVNGTSYKATPHSIDGVSADPRKWRGPYRPTAWPGLPLATTPRTFPADSNDIDFGVSVLP